DGGSIAGLVQGLSGRDTLDFSALFSGVVVNLQTRSVAGVVGSFASIEEVIGTDLTGTLIGADSTSTLPWHHSGAGAGVVGAYTFSGFEKLVAGSGVNTLSYASFTTGVRVSLQDGTATGFTAISGFLNVTGGSGDDILIGDANNNTLTGGAG